MRFSKGVSRAGGSNKINIVLITYNAIVSETFSYFQLFLNTFSFFCQTWHCKTCYCSLLLEKLLWITTTNLNSGSFDILKLLNINKTCYSHLLGFNKKKLQPNLRLKTMHVKAWRFPKITPFWFFNKITTDYILYRST